MAIVEAIKEIESNGGENCGRGQSGEYGCFQYMPGTWELYAEEVTGYIPEQTKINEEYVTLHKVEQWLRQGYTAKEVALLWNQGNAGPCGSGTNRHGVRYNSCSYQSKLMTLTGNGR